MGLWNNTVYVYNFTILHCIKILFNAAACFSSSIVSGPRESHVIGEEEENGTIANISFKTAAGLGGSIIVGPRESHVISAVLSSRR